MKKNILFEQMQKQNKAAQELIFCSQCIETVATYFSLPEDYTIDKTRKREYVFARQICMALMLKHTKLTLNRIGEMFNKDHATVLHSQKTISNLCYSSKKIKSEVQELEKLIMFKVKIVSQKKSDGKSFYYINFDDYTSFRFNDDKGIIFTGFTEIEIYNFLNYLKAPSLDIKNHKKTGFYILEKNNNDSNS